MLTSGGIGELDIGGYGEALDMFGQAAQILRRTGDELGLARTFNYRGLAQQGLGRAEAAQCFRQAVRECSRCGDNRAAGLARLNLAEMEIAAMRFDVAAEQAVDAGEVLAAEGDSYNEARATVLLGRAQLHLGRLDEAGRSLEAALGSLRRIGSAREAARALEALGELAEVRGLPVLAEGRYREAADLYATLRVPAAASLRARIERLASRPPDQKT